MEVRVLETTGAGWFKESIWTKPEPTDDQIEVKAVMTGVCRSDIDMMNGNFGPLPLEMQGHEGLGIVTKVGSKIKGVAVGDYVATRGEPAYADYYNVRNEEFVIVPELHPRYIIEPVACAVNCVFQLPADKRSGRTVILGSGFLAWVIFNTLTMDPEHLDMEIDVVGNSNRDLWLNKLQAEPTGEYDVVFDLSSRTDVFDKPILKDNATVILGAQKTVTTDFANLLWKSCTIKFPSPRNYTFFHAMNLALDMVKDGRLDVDKFWTKAYNRNTEWQQAFADGNNRPQGYSRGYIYWNVNGN